MSIVSDIEIRLRADIARLQADMTQARTAVSGAMSGISKAVDSAMSHIKQLAGAIAVGAFVGFIKDAIDAVDALTDLSTRTGITVEDLAGLAYGAKLSGTELEAAATSINKLSVSMGKEGDRFAKLGVTASEPIEAFKQIADIFKSIQDPQARAAFGAEALGKAWQESAVLLSEGSAGITELMARGHELSGVTTQNSADAAKFNDTLDEITATAGGLKNRLAVELLPTLNDLASQFLAVSTQGDGTKKVVDNISSAVKVAISVGTILYGVFDSVATVIALVILQLKTFTEGLIDTFREMVQVNRNWGKVGKAISDTFTGVASNLGWAGKEVADTWSSVGTTVSTTWTGAAKDVKDAAAVMEGVEFPDPFGIDAKEAADAAARAEAFVKYGEAQAAAKKLAGEAAAAAKKEQEAYRAVITTLGERIAAGKAELAVGRELTEAEKARIKFDSELATGKLKLTRAHENHVRALMAEAEAMDKAAVSAKKVRDAIQSLTDEQNASYISLANEVEGNKDAVENYGLSKEAIELLTIARLEDRLARKGELDMGEAYAAQLEREIVLRKENAAALGGLDTLIAQKKAADDNLATQTKMWESIDDTAHSVFTSIFDSGKSAFDRLRDALKTGLYDLLYQMTVKKFIISIGAAVSGTGSGVAAAGDLAGVGGAGAGGTGITGLVQSAKTAYTIATQGFSGVAAGIGGSIATLGNIFGSSAVSAFGTGMGLTAAQASTAAAAYGSAGMAGTGSALTAGAAAAPLVAAAAGIAAGVLGGKLISGEYGKTATVVGGTGIGAVTGAFLGGPIGAAIGGAIGGVIGGIGNRLFGMADKKYGETGITGSLSGTGFTGNEYAKWSQKGGFFRSDKSGTDKSAVDSTTAQAFVDTYAAIRDVSAVLAKTIGADTSALATRVQALNINLTGLTSETDRLAAVTKFFEGVGDTIAGELVPGLAQFKQGTETLSATLQRVASDYAGVEAALQMVGSDSQSAFGAVGVASIAAREKLIKLAGSLDALSSGTSFFAENFLTTAQQMEPVIKSVDDTLAALGMSNVKTTTQFADAVLNLTKSGALATDSGQQLYVQLLALAPAFKAVADYGDQVNGSLQDRLALQAEIDKLTLTSAQLRAKERATIGSNNLALYDQLQALNDLAAARTAETDKLTAVATEARSFAASLSTVLDSLSQGSLSTLTPLQKLADAQGKYQQTLAAAQAGDESARGALAAAAQAYLTADQVVNASSSRYAADAARVQAELAALASAAVGQATDAEKQLAVLTSQADGILKVNESVNLATTSIVAAIDNLRATGYDVPTSTMSTGRSTSTASTGGPDTVALANALASVQKELAGMRAEAAQHAGYIADTVATSSAANADTITQGTKSAAMDQVYAEQLTPKVT